ncbi:MAG: ComEC/Rec2 family competence protein, partial [bacterium]
MPIPDAAIISSLRRRPLLGLTLCWAVGIVAGAYTPLSALAWAAAGVLFLLAWGALIPLRRGGGLALGLAALCLGAALYTFQATPAAPGQARYLPPGGVVVTGYALEPPTRNNDNWHVDFQVTAMRHGENWWTATPRIYLAGSGAAPQPGKYAVILGTVRTEEEPGNPYGFSWRSTLEANGLQYRVTALKVSESRDTAPTPRLYALRTLLSERLHASMPGAYGPLYAQLLDSIVLGIHGAPLPPQLVESFRRAGTIHLLVVSGGQVAMLAGALLWPLWLLRRRRGQTDFPKLQIVLLLLSLPVLGLYVMLADTGPSVDRAVLMVLLITFSLFLAFSPLARLRSFRPDSLTLLAAAALVLLVIRPAQLFSPSAQLSFAAVAGLCIVTPVLMRLLHRLPGPLGLYLSATLGAQAFTYPVLAWYFGSAPVLGPITNM